MSRRARRFTPPWQQPEWWAELEASERDPVLDDLLYAPGEVRPHEKSLPSMLNSPVYQNPYMNLVVVAPFGLVSWWMFVMVPAPWNWICMAFFGMVPLVAVVVQIPRFAPWHRRRGIARNYLDQHPGAHFPNELRWFT